MKQDKNQRIEIAKERFRNGNNCAQSVLFAFADFDCIDENTVLNIASGFGGGIAREQEVCGAFSGAVMALGLFYGRAVDAQDTNYTYEKIQTLSKRFKEKFGSIRCREILDGCDLKTETGRQSFQEKDYFNVKCLSCIETSAEYLISQRVPE